MTQSPTSDTELPPTPDAPLSAAEAEADAVVALEPPAFDGGEPPAAKDEREPTPAPNPVLEAIRRLDDRLEESQRLLARQTEIATSLHAENQRLKAGELRRAQMPLVRDLIRVYDDLGRLLGVPGDDTAEAARKLLTDARDMLIDALARNGVDATHADAGEPLNPKLHRVAGIELTEDPAADRTIAAVMRTGFAWEEGGAIRAADVRVYKHRPLAQPAATFPEPAAAEPARPTT